ncbi:MAG: ferrous iron transport protein B [Saprospiraceae bacterium]|nr:MAG: ferrous iron transport protein B [Saprospiraceae bacterium]
MHHHELGDISSPSSTRPLTVALLGNPNCGKSSIFNRLTGLRQKVGNFPGVTVEKKSGNLRLDDGQVVHLIDFPGAYSFYPNSQDERIVVQSLANPKAEHYPDAILYVADVTKLDKHLLLFSQLRDLNLPLVLLLNMSDVAERDGIVLDTKLLAARFKVPVVLLSGRTGSGFKALKLAIAQIKTGVAASEHKNRRLNAIEKKVSQRVQAILPDLNPYQAVLIAHHVDWLPYLDSTQKAAIRQINSEEGFKSLNCQVEETMHRYDIFTPLVQQVLQTKAEEKSTLTTRLDSVLTHRIAGPLIFFAIMLLVFQAIFAWASYPMDWIEWGFAQAEAGINAVLPAGWLTSLLTEGILAGLGGIVVFVPQIAILFFLISLLEEVGYMARAAFIFDRVMQAFGLNGRSIVALISGGACAIPAIMSTRTIGNWKERLITILVTPFISCSARIPVYTVLIGFVVAERTVWGIFNLQGLAFMGLYLLGIAAALLAALVFKWILKTSEHSFLLLELPEYRSPVLRNVGITVWEKVKAFVVEAGKVILVISVILWALASYGPPGEMEAATQAARDRAQQEQMDETTAENLIAAKKIEASYAGHLGKAIEPAIAPLGFDWKIGIALITSFAAREVFVGTMATIYSIGSDDDEYSVRNRMAKERNPDTGQLVYTQATSFSLLLFYVFAMMCMSTLAVVKRETNSWKWPIIQFLFMTGLAYLASFVAYQVMT